MRQALLRLCFALAAISLAHVEAKPLRRFCDSKNLKRTKALRQIMKIEIEDGQPRMNDVWGEKHRDNIRRAEELASRVRRQSSRDDRMSVFLDDPSRHRTHVLLRRQVLVGVRTTISF